MIIFSRKLLYFSGLLVIAESSQQTAKHKFRRTLELLSLPPIERVAAICGEKASRAVEMYDYFLGVLADPERRKVLEITSRDKQTEAFRDVKNTGHHFTTALMQLLRNTYDVSHPIHRGIIL